VLYRPSEVAAPGTNQRVHQWLRRRLERVLREPEPIRQRDMMPGLGESGVTRLLGSGVALHALVE
jgi:hypothetical protein